MKHLRAVILPGIAVVTLVVLALSGSTGASAAILPQHTHGPATCGVWSKVASPNVGTSTNFLNGVAAISSTDVWAVGDYGNGNGGLTLVEHWNGTHWKVVASPNVNNSLSDSLSGVAAIAANDVWAVGSYRDASNTQQTLIEHWNGAQWSIVQSPNVQSLFNVLAAISPVSAKDIWAVGNASGGNGFQPLFEHWNGAQWSIVQSQGTGGLSGVAAIASNDVWAVGAISGNNIQTLIEHWNGSTWSVVSSSGPGVAINNLNGIAAISANNVWAVGDDADSGAPSAQYRPLIEHWNGSSWSVVTIRMRGTSDFINGISAVSASNIWAVGFYRTSLDPNGPYFTFIEHWNGSAWSVVKSPSPGSENNGLAAAARVPATSSVWAVGFKQSNGIYQTLTEFYC
jgi:hypothetical protein